MDKYDIYIDGENECTVYATCEDGAIQQYITELDIEARKRD